ncbi:MAG: hypothetical protein F4X19_15305 [Acidobacteria bacterium]|nr:hypothetical protein [Acidobacteriota bacterium]
MTHRRSFLASMAAGAWLPAAVSQARAESSRPAGRKIRVGALNVGEYTFWGIWAEILASQGLFGGGLLNMEITHCWDVNPKLANEFADKYGCVAVDRYDGMLGKVDAIGFGGLYEVPWQHRLAWPYVEAGVPTYLSRPFSYRLRDIDAILNLAAKKGTPLMATSVQEHYYQASYLKARLGNVGVIKGVHGLCFTDEYPAHFHIQWFILRALGYEVEKVSLFTDDERKATWLQDTMLFRGSEGQPPFLAALHGVSGTHHLYLKVTGDKGRETITMDRSPDRRETLYYYFAPQLMDMQRTFQGDSYQSFDVIRKKTQVFLAGYYSYLEKGGSLFPVDQVPEDWSPRHFRPNWIDESMFSAKS